MERPSFDGVEFYSANDWSLGENLQRSALILDSFSDDISAYNSINEIIQLYNVQQVVNCGAKLEAWSDEEYKQYQTQTKGLSAVIGRFLGGITDDSFLEIYESVAIGYVEDFWELFENYKVYRKISSSALYQLLCQHDSALHFVLKHKSIVNEYDEEIASVMRTSKQTATIIARAFLEKQENISQLFFPTHLQKSEYEELLQEYIQSPDCNPGILHLIAIAQSSEDCPISDKLRLSAQKRQNKRFEEIMVNSAPLGIGISVAFDHIADIKKMVHNGDTFEFTYDIDWLIENLDYPTILNNFIYVFEQFDLCMRSNLVSVESKISAIEKAIGTKGKKEYSPGYSFTVFQSLYQFQVFAYYSILQKHGIFLEDVFKWFFEQYLPQEFNACGFHFNPPSQGTSYIEKCRTMASEMEGVLKQFRMYANDGEINQELYEMSSEHIVFGNLPSMNADKYAYASGRIIQAAMHHLFSDQSLLSFLPTTKESFHSCYDLLLHKDCHLADFGKMQKQTLQWLIDKSFILIDENGILRTECSKVNTIKDLYDHDVICPNCAGARKAIIDNWVQSGELKIENTLFSKPEQDYLNYMLNKSAFSNGLDLRNKYSHSTYPSDESQQRSDYYQLLKIMILIIGKINDEFCLKEKRSSCSVDEAEGR